MAPGTSLAPRSQRNLSQTSAAASCGGSNTQQRVALGFASGAVAVLQRPTQEGDGSGWGGAIEALRQARAGGAEQAASAWLDRLVEGAPSSEDGAAQVAALALDTSGERLVALLGAADGSCSVCEASVLGGSGDGLTGGLRLEAGAPRQVAGANAASAGAPTAALSHASVDAPSGGGVRYVLGRGGAVHAGDSGGADRTAWDAGEGGVALGWAARASAWAPAGRLLALGGAGGALALVDGARVSRRVECHGRMPAGAAGDVVQLAWRPGGASLLALAQQGEVCVLDACLRPLIALSGAAGTPAASLRLPGAGPDAGAEAPEGRALACWEAAGVDTEAPQRALLLPPGRPAAVLGWVGPTTAEALAAHYASSGEGEAAVGVLRAIEEPQRRVVALASHAMLALRTIDEHSEETVGTLVAAATALATALGAVSAADGDSGAAEGRQAHAVGAHALRQCVDALLGMEPPRLETALRVASAGSSVQALSEVYLAAAELGHPKLSHRIKAEIERLEGGRAVSRRLFDAEKTVKRAKVRFFAADDVQEPAATTTTGEQPEATPAEAPVAEAQVAVAQGAKIEGEKQPEKEAVAEERASEIVAPAKQALSTAILPKTAPAPRLIRASKAAAKPRNVASAVRLGAGALESLAAIAAVPATPQVRQVTGAALAASAAMEASPSFSMALPAGANLRALAVASPAKGAGAQHTPAAAVTSGAASARRDSLHGSDGASNSPDGGSNGSPDQGTLRGSDGASNSPAGSAGEPEAPPAGAALHASRSTDSAEIDAVTDELVRDATAEASKEPEHTEATNAGGAGGFEAFRPAFVRVTGVVSTPNVRVRPAASLAEGEAAIAAGLPTAKRVRVFRRTDGGLPRPAAPDFDAAVGMGSDEGPAAAASPEPERDAEAVLVGRVVAHTATDGTPERHEVPPRARALSTIERARVFRRSAAVATTPNVREQVRRPQLVSERAAMQEVPAAVRGPVLEGAVVSPALGVLDGSLVAAPGDDSKRVEGSLTAPAVRVDFVSDTAPSGRMISGTATTSYDAQPDDTTVTPVPEGDAPPAAAAPAADSYAALAPDADAAPATQPAPAVEVVDSGAQCDLLLPGRHVRWRGRPTPELSGGDERGLMLLRRLDVNAGGGQGAEDASHDLHASGSPERQMPRLLRRKVGPPGTPAGQKRGKECDGEAHALGLSVGPALVRRGRTCIEPHAGRARCRLLRL